MLNLKEIKEVAQLYFYYSFNLGYYYFYSVGLFAYNKLIKHLIYENNVIAT